MKDFRVFYLLLLFLAVIAAAFYQGRLLPLVLVVLLIFPAVSFILTAITFFALKISAPPEEISAVRGSAAVLCFKIRNRFIIPLSPMMIFGIFPSGDTFSENFIPANVPPLSTVEVRIEIHFSHCGIYETGADFAEIHDILKIFTFKKHFRTGNRTRLFVYPKENGFGAEARSALSDTGEALPMHTGGKDFSAVRTYEDGDDIRFVHWKLSAKSESLIIKQSEAPKDSDVALLLDFPVPFQKTERGMTAADTLIEFAVSLALSGIDGNFSVNIIIRDDETGSVTFTVRSREDLRAFEVAAIAANKFPAVPATEKANGKKPGKFGKSGKPEKFGKPEKSGKAGKSVYADFLKLYFTNDADKRPGAAGVYLFSPDYRDKTADFLSECAAVSRAKITVVTANGFLPEESFSEKIRAIPGVEMMIV
ncbi:hypothetical protein FACS189499_08440 [Clostridia bacterium]|nr:hypothetical protein FACS189499_08440 [Clostridia bacterium]